MRAPNSAVQYVDVNAPPSGVRSIGAIQRQAALINPVEAPRGVVLGAVVNRDWLDADFSVLLNVGDARVLMRASACASVISIA